MVLVLDRMAGGISTLRAVLALLLPFGVHGVVANVVEPVVFSGGHGKEGTEVRSQNRPLPLVPFMVPFMVPFTDPWIMGLVIEIRSDRLISDRRAPVPQVDPAVMLVSLFIWADIWGAMGLVLAVPLTVCFRLICRDLHRKHSNATGVFGVLDRMLGGEFVFDSTIVSTVPPPEH